MNNLIRQAQRQMTLTSATVLLSGSLLLTSLLGIVRTKLINAEFNNFATGAYFGAFKLPEFIFYTLAGGALSVAFIPYLSDKVFTKDRRKAWELTSSVLNSVSFFMLIACLVLVIFPRPILEHIVVPGFSDQQLDLAAQIMRLAATSPLVFSVAHILGSVQQVFGRFFFYALSPIFYNLSIIASIHLFQDSMGVVSLGVGAAAGGLLSLTILALGMSRLEFRHSWKINFKDASFIKVFKALPFRSFDQGIVYINSIVQTRLASSLTISAVTNLENALLLYNAPITLLGAAIGTAAFPRFTKRLSQNRPDLFKKEFLSILRAVVWMAIPAAIICYFARDHLARIIFTRDNREIAMVFGWLCLGISFRTLYSIMTRFFYAQKDTLTPLLVTAMAFFANIVLSWSLSEKYGVIGFGMATSVVVSLEILVITLIIQRRYPGLFNWPFIRGLFQIATISLVAACTGWWMGGLLPVAGDDDTLVLLVKVGLIACCVFLVHWAVSYMYKVKEAKNALDYAKKLGTRLNNRLYRKR